MFCVHTCEYLLNTSTLLQNIRMSIHICPKLFIIPDIFLIPNCFYVSVKVFVIIKNERIVETLHYTV